MVTSTTSKPRGDAYNKTIGKAMDDGDLPFIVNGDLVADESAPFVGFSEQNPYGQAAYAFLVALDVTTPATGAATMDVGVSSTATGSADDLLDGTDVGAAAIFANNHDDPGTNGKKLVKVAADDFVNGIGSADLAGLVGRYSLGFIRA